MMKVAVYVVVILGLQFLGTFGYVLPTGQFSPFQSDAVNTYNDQAGTVHRRIVESRLASSQIFKGILARYMKNNDLGMADKVALRSASIKTESVIAEWDKLQEMRRSFLLSDFQLRERLLEPSCNNLGLAKLADYIPVLEAQNQLDLSLSDVADNTIDDEVWYKDAPRPAKKSILRGWLVVLRRTFAHGREMRRFGRRIRKYRDVTLKITAKPFEMEDLKQLSPKVQMEYNQLLKEHEYLICSLSGKFGDFDDNEKELFIECLEDIEERWDMVYQRFQLMGVLNPEYVEQCNAYLADLGLNEQEYKKICKMNRKIILDDELEEIPYFSDGSNMEQSKQTRFGALRRLPKRCFGRIRKLVGDPIARAREARARDAVKTN